MEISQFICIANQMTDFYMMRIFSKRYFWIECRTGAVSGKEFFVTIVYGFQLLTVVTESCVLDVVGVLDPFLLPLVILLCLVDSWHVLNLKIMILCMHLFMGICIHYFSQLFFFFDLPPRVFYCNLIWLNVLT